mgnify:FL=1
MINNKYYDLINNNCISSVEGIIPSTYTESKYSISFTTATIDGGLYYYFIDLFNITATVQRLSTISICDTVGCTNDFKQVFEKAKNEDENENVQCDIHPVFKDILKRFNNVNVL